MKQATQGTTRLAELQYLLRYCGLKQARPLSQSKLACLAGLLRLLPVVTMNVYTAVSDAKTLHALKRLGRQLGS